MKRVTKEVISIKHMEVYEEDRDTFRKLAKQKGISIRKYMHFLAQNAHKLNR